MHARRPARADAGPPRTGWQPEGHRATGASAAQKLPSLSTAPEHCAGGTLAALKFAWAGDCPTTAPGPPLSRGKRKESAEETHFRLPGEGRDPGATAHWVATRRTSGHRGLRGTEAAVSFNSTRALCRRNACCAEVRLGRDCPTTAPGPPLSRGKRKESAEETHFRLPGEGRDPGTTAHWVATRRTSGHRGLRGTEAAVSFNNTRDIVPAERLLR